MNSLKPIHVLPHHVAERIAAGEVIERPASVVKELLENAVDADATDIQVTLHDGGKELIEVVDNGNGMRKDDLILSVQRHATSKLQNISDLDYLNTLGFRGEALASIAAVSDIRITSAILHHDAYQMHWQDQRPSSPEPIKVTYGHFLHKPHGTEIHVESLFSTYPARLKFLKSSSAETQHVKEWITRLGLAYPGITFSFKTEDKTLLSLKASSLEERLRTVLDATGTIDFEKIYLNDQDCIEIYWVRGSSVSHAKKFIQIVNDRPLKDRFLQQAVMAGLKQALIPGQYPALALWVRINPSDIDFNVHPTKTEVRFKDTSSIFTAIQRALKQILQNQTFGWKPLHAPLQIPQQQPAEQPSTPAFIPPRQEPTTPTPRFYPKPLSPLPSAPPLIENPVGHRYLGRIFGTYLLFEHHQELLLVDQHAAHERILFEQQKISTSAQHLLEPMNFELTSEMFHALKPHEELFQKAQLHFSGIAPSRMRLTALPTNWTQGNIRQRVYNLFERALETSFNTLTENEKIRVLQIDAWVWESNAQTACKKSLRANDAIHELSALALLKSLLECQHPQHCPHGRPTIHSYSEKQLHRIFGREHPSHALSALSLE